MSREQKRPWAMAPRASMPYRRAEITMFFRWRKPFKPSISSPAPSLNNVWIGVLTHRQYYNGPWEKVKLFSMGRFYGSGEEDAGLFEGLGHPAIGALFGAAQGMQVDAAGEIGQGSGSVSLYGLYKLRHIIPVG